MKKILFFLLASLLFSCNQDSITESSAPDKIPNREERRIDTVVTENIETGEKEILIINSPKDSTLLTGKADTLLIDDPKNPGKFIKTITLN